MAKERRKINNDEMGVVSVGNQSSQNRPLKKRKGGGCLKAFIVTLCIVIGVLAILVVGGLFVGDAIMKSNVGISLFDVFAVVGDAGDVDEKEIVTNGYTSDDTAAFYDNANAMLYFKTGEDAALNSEYIRELLDEVRAGDKANIMSSLLGILESDNFDREKLGAYNGWQDDIEHTSGLTAVTDRQFAAFFDDLVISSGFIDGMLPEEMTEILGDKQIKDIMSLEQLIISKGSDMTEAARAKIDAVADHAYMTMTVSLNIKDAVNSALPSLDKLAGFPVSMFGWLIDWILPDNAFATATVDLSDASSGIVFELNSLAGEECEMGAAREEIISKYRDADNKITKMDRMFIVIEHFSGTDLRQTLNENMSDALSYICKSDEGISMANFIDLDSVTATDKGNSFKLDIYGLLTDALNENTGGTARPEDIIVLMQALLCTEESGAYADDYAHRADLYAPMDADIATALAQCGFDSLENVKTEADYERLLAAYGALEYKTTGATLTDKENIFEEEFMAAFAKAYCLDLNKYDDLNKVVGEYSFSEIAALFGMSSDGGASSVELTDLLDGAKLAEAAGSSKVETLRVTDRMLGAIMLSLLPEYAADAGYGDYGIELRTLKISRRADADDVLHDLVTVVFTLEISELISGEAAGDYIKGVMPDYISLGVTVDLTPGMAAENRLAAEIACYNDITEAGSDGVLNGLTSGRLIEALERIVPGIDLDSLLDVMSDGMSSVVDNMTNVMPAFAFVESPDNSSYYAEFPSIFDLTASILGLDSSDKPEDERVSGAQLKSAISYIDNYSYDDSYDVPADANYNDFLSSVQQNYYIADQLTDFDSIFDALTGEFNAATLRLNEAKTYSYGNLSAHVVEQYMGMLYDTRDAGEIAARMNETDLTAIMRDFAATYLTEGTELLRAEVTENGIVVYARVATSSMLDAQYSSLLDCEYIYATITIDLTVVVDNAYAAAITVNGQGEGGSDFDTLMRIVKAFGADSFDLDGIAGDIGRAVYDALINLKNADIDYSLDAARGEIVLEDFYGYALKLLLGENAASYTASDLKNALQGIRMTEVNTETVKYYVTESGADASANAPNFDPTVLTANRLATEEIDPQDLLLPNSMDVAMLDNQLGKWINDYKRAGGGDSLGEFAAMNALPDVKSGNASTFYTFANGFDDSLAANGEYVAMIFEASTADLVTSGANLSGVLPNTIFMTVVYTYDSQTKDMTYAYLRINGLTSVQQDLLIDICGVTDFDATVSQHARDAATLLDGLGFEIDGEVTGTACGRLTLALASLITE